KSSRRRCDRDARRRYLKLISGDRDIVSSWLDRIHKMLQDYRSNLVNPEASCKSCLNIHETISNLLPWFWKRWARARKIVCFEVGRAAREIRYRMGSRGGGDAADGLARE